MEYYVKAHRDYVAVTYVDEFTTPEDVLQYAALVRQIVTGMDKKRILLDERQQEVSLDAYDAYRVSHSVETDSFVAAGIRIACVIKPEHVETKGVFETSLRNQALNIRMFTDPDEALSWLLT